MKKTNMKNKIDKELEKIQLNDNVKNNIRKNIDGKFTYRKSNQIIKRIVACLICVFLLGTTVSAGYYILNKVQLNEKVLPELDSMQVKEINKLEIAPDEYGMFNESYDNYNTIKEKLGVKLLDTPLSKNNLYMQGHIMTDEKDFAVITVDNYIRGEEYVSPISLEINLILSKSQLSNGWDTEYLGNYEFIEHYISSQGYKVNIIQDRIDNTDNYVSEKIAIFVADGIRYSLKGRTSVTILKSIVDTME